MLYNVYLIIKIRKMNTFNINGYGFCYTDMIGKSFIYADYAYIMHFCIHNTSTLG